jgi:methionine-rich copper-binding protein CopC
VRPAAPRSPRARRLLWLLLPLAVLCAPGPARGHAIVLESSPAHDAVVDRAPDAVLLRFNGKIVHRLSRASIEPAPGSASGAVPRVRPVSIDLSGEEASPGPDRLRVRLPALPGGVWVLRYRVLAADGHVTAGALRFTIRTAQ